MRRFSPLPLVFLCCILSVCLSMIGCGEDEEPEQASDFAGVWDGDPGISCGPRFNCQVETVTMTLSGPDRWVEGKAVLQETTGTYTHAGIGGSVTNGILSYVLPLSDLETGDPDCADWDVSCTGTLNQDKTLLTTECEGRMCFDGFGWAWWIPEFNRRQRKW